MGTDRSVEGPPHDRRCPNPAHGEAAYQRRQATSSVIPEGSRPGVQSVGRIEAGAARQGASLAWREIPVRLLPHQRPLVFREPGRGRVGPSGSEATGWHHSDGAREGTRERSQGKRPFEDRQMLSAFQGGFSLDPEATAGSPIPVQPHYLS